MSVTGGSIHILGKRVIGLLKGRGTEAVLARGVGGAFAAAVLSNLLALGMSVLTARVIGGEQFGVFVYVWTWLNLLSLFSAAGWDVAALRFLSTYKVSGEWGLFAGL